MADVRRLAAVEALGMRLPVGPVEQMIAESVPDPRIWLIPVDAAQLSRLEHHLDLIARLLERLEGLGEAVEADPVGDQAAGRDAAAAQQVDHDLEVAPAVDEHEGQIELLGDRLGREEAVRGHAQAHDHHAGIERRVVDRELQAARHADAVEHHARLAAGQLLHAAWHVLAAGIDRGGGAELDRALGPAADQVAHHDVAGAEEAAPQRDRDADRAGADDQHAIAGLEARLGDRVQPDRERLDQGPLVKAHRIGQPQGGRGADAGVFGIGAGQRRGRAHRDLLAAIGAAGGAMRAPAATDERLRADPLADAPLAAQLAPDLHHLARELVAHDRAGLERAPAGVAIGALRPVQIGAADAAGAHFQDQIARARRRVGHVLDHERRARRLEHGGFHRHGLHER